MESQKILIEENNWDVLIILDACRYDFFERIYPKYLNGKLSKVKSSGTNTCLWVVNTFGDAYFDDVVYVSASGWVNSIGKRKDAEVGRKEPEGMLDFVGKKHFWKIIDVWKKGWSEELETVHPKEVNKFAHIARDLHGEKRLIIHYMQPHYPYISLAQEKNHIKETLHSRNENSSILRWAKNNSIMQSIYEFTVKKITRIGGHEMIWRIRSALNLSNTHMGAVWEEVGRDGLRKAYAENLSIVLREVRKLCEDYEGKVIVTSDHGELLGEKKLYGHHGWSDHPILWEVPWLEVKK